MRTRTKSLLWPVVAVSALCASLAQADPITPHRVNEKIQLSNDVSVTVTAGDSFSRSELGPAVDSPAVALVLNLNFEPKPESYPLLTCGPGRSCFTVAIGDATLDATAFITYTAREQVSDKWDRRRPERQRWTSDQFVMWALRERCTLSIAFPLAPGQDALPKTLTVGFKIADTPHSLTVAIE